MKAHGTRGFTLVEVMTVVAIIGILAGTSINFGLQQYERAQQRSYVNQWLGGLAFARAEAMRRGTTVAVSCINTRDMLIFIDSNLNGVRDSSEETLRFVPAPRDDLACTFATSSLSPELITLYYLASGQSASTALSTLLAPVLGGSTSAFLSTSSFLLQLGKYPIQRQGRGVVGPWKTAINIGSSGTLVN